MDRPTDPPEGTDISSGASGSSPNALRAAIPRLPWPFVTWLVVFYAVWLGLVIVGDAWSVLADHVGIAIAMALGSYFAGSTPMGGGTVGFPVIVLIFDQPATLGRDFSLAIQSIGMVSAAILIFALRQPLERRMLGWAMAGATIGTPLGLAVIAPLVPDLAVKLIFAVTWAAFGALHLAKRREIVAHSGITDLPPRLDRLLGFATGLAASASIVATTGVGIDLAVYVILVLVCRADLKIAVPTSVVLMAYTSVVGIAAQAALAWLLPDRHGLAPDLYGNWLAAAPVVAIGAPVGVVVVRLVPRGLTLAIVSVLCLGQFGWTLWHERAVLTAWIVVASVVAFAALNVVFMAMYAWGQRRSASDRRDGDGGVAGPQS